MERKTKGLGVRMCTFQIPTVNANIMGRKRELKTVATIMITGKENLDAEEGIEGKGIRRGSRAVMYMYLLPKMNSTVMYCKRVLIKKKKKKSK